MENNQNSMTALVSAFGRAYHNENDSPVIFRDPVARRLMTDDEYRQVSGYMAGGLSFFAPEKTEELKDPAEALRYVVQTQIAPTPLARARYCEDMLENAIRLGAEQYVILGAGMDTYAYRAKSSNGIRIFEVDRPGTQDFKKRKIADAGIAIPDNLRCIPVDFTKDGFAAALASAGFVTRARSFFSLLGVSYYLTKERLQTLLTTIAALTPQGSSIVFDYADENLFISKVKRVQNMVAMAEASGEPMKSRFSYAELEKLLEEAGWLIYEHLSPAEIETRYFAGRSDYLHAFEHINYVLAVTGK
jgi:methyltransferase (TIGR00027 family)